MDAEIPISPLNFPYAAALSIFQAKGQFLMPSSRIKSKHGGKRDRGLSISGILYTLRVFTFRRTPTRYISQQQLNNTFLYIFLLITAKPTHRVAQPGYGNIAEDRGYDSDEEYPKIMRSPSHSSMSVSGPYHHSHHGEIGSMDFSVGRST